MDCCASELLKPSWRSTGAAWRFVVYANNDSSKSSNLPWQAKSAVSSEGAQTLASQWLPQHHKTDKILRCPYCVEGETFKEMLRHVSGDWFICTECSHLALPANSFFQCTCRRCVAVTAAQEKLNPKSSIQAGLDRILKPTNKK